MSRQGALAYIVIAAAIALAATPASAVVKGTGSALGAYTVRLVGHYYCSGVAIARREVVTAGHCAHGMRVLAGGHSLRIVRVTRSARLDDGRRVQVSGDAAILELAAPLPASITAAPIGAGGGDSFTIAGYGTTDEHWRSYGALHGATLVSAGAHVLVDPSRGGSIGASACFGDSGGPVMRGDELVGVITRADYPHKRIACGDLTHWAPVTVSGTAEAESQVETPPAAMPPVHRALRHRAHKVETAAADWFAPVAARSSQHKTANR